LAWTNWAALVTFVQVFDLRTGTKILEKMYNEPSYVAPGQFYGNILISRGPNQDVVTDVLQDKNIIVPERIMCATIVGDELWSVCSKDNSIIKYNLTTMATQKYDVNEDINLLISSTYSDYNANCCITDIKIFDGIVWLCVSVTKVIWVDVSSPPTCKVLGSMMCPSEPVKTTQLPNGTLSCSSTHFSHIMSFRDEDIELPIQVLQIETTGEFKIMDIIQGDLNSIVLQHFPSSVTSQIVFEDETQRYCIIYSYASPLPINFFAETAKQWPIQIESHKTGIFQLVHFNSQEKRINLPVGQHLAFGPCWVFYEKKVSGAWKRSSPVDKWFYFKARVGQE
jgi:hypothetical protein